MPHILSESLVADLMKQSYDMAKFSPDPSTQNGAILANMEGRILGNGCNDFPPGVDVRYWHGEKEDKYARVVHAEVSAILDAARNGCETDNSILICGWSACSNCAKHIAAAGVQQLIRHTFSNSGGDTGSHWYEDCRIGDQIMTEAGVEIIEITPIPYEIELRRNGKIWTPNASQQDKLSSSV